MSDTKALYDVVAKALANWGESKAQDALETLMGRLRGAEEARDHAVDTMRSARHTLDALASLHEIGDHAYEELACHLKDEPNGHEGERIITRAEADNAALLKALHSAYKPHVGECSQWSAATGQQVRPCPCGLDALLDAEHPGAALLEELEGLRKQVETQKTKVSTLQFELATARNAALEDAAKVADKHNTDWEVSIEIRALKTKEDWTWRVVE